LSARPVFLARHGETASNLENRYAGRTPEPLIRSGRAQIARLADTLAAHGITQIWTSSVGRALESARMVGDRLGLSPRIDERLDEMRLGPWEGRTEGEVAREFPEAYALWLTQPDQVALQGRETLGQVAARAMAVVADARATSEAVLLITHVAPIRVAVLSTLRLPLAAYKRVAVPNGSCIRLECATRQAVWHPHGGSVRAQIERAGIAAA
jgi:broad specificity phosphatase PhoE